jgi:hypothetical protein
MMIRVSTQRMANATNLVKAIRAMGFYIAQQELINLIAENMALLQNRAQSQMALVITVALKTASGSLVLRQRSVCISLSSRPTQPWSVSSSINARRQIVYHQLRLQGCQAQM